VNIREYFRRGRKMTIETQHRSKTERFEEIAIPHIDSVYRFALYTARNESDAKDLVQDTYLKAYRFFDKFQEGTDCKAWLFKILKNTFINTMRRNKKHNHNVSISELKEQGVIVPDMDSDPEEEIFGDLFDDTISIAVNSLRDQYKTVVLLADVEGLSYREIANIVGCPIGTVMSRLHRGRNMLRKRLRRYADQYGYVMEAKAVSG
jgi:RNA polymerase sigma-70 factor (ECF subfamily)